MESEDLNDNVLTGADSVLITNDLTVKGTSVPLLYRTVIKKICFTFIPEHIECRAGKEHTVLNSCVLKKA